MQEFSKFVLTADTESLHSTTGCTGYSTHGTLNQAVTALIATVPEESLAKSAGLCHGNDAEARQLPHQRMSMRDPERTLSWQIGSAAVSCCRHERRNRRNHGMVVLSAAQVSTAHGIGRSGSRMRSEVRGCEGEVTVSQLTSDTLRGRCDQAELLSQTAKKLWYLAPTISRKDWILLDSLPALCWAWAHLL